ncbi:ABC transporter ATP-binding protein [Sodalis sp. dw_96]|uniref:ABC transporter ATP-binding protein n=1 Tax=Sodalis sp. dw_96 TaxID=2719794 RepID=UPI001BD5C6BF|nr:ABC transporter ATP-binding protein [Sodalis sp. dw_96]
MNHSPSADGTLTLPESLNSSDHDVHPLLEVRHLTKRFPVRQGFASRWFNAVDDVSFHVRARETYALVGESGSGKSTTGRTVLRLVEAGAGQVRFDGKDVFTLRAKPLREWRKEVQMIFQDPLSSLDPKRSIGYSIEEPLIIHRIGTRRERLERVRQLLIRVGFTAADAGRYPHEFSGGQRQRIGIAKALILNPRLIICDEPVSALDVSIQSQILNLLMELQREQALSYLFIAHDLSVVHHIADRIGVMYRGRIVEEAPTETLFSSPRHPYTQFLLASIPPTHPRLKNTGSLPVITDTGGPRRRQGGCVFSDRCPYARPACHEQTPPERQVGRQHRVACFLYP